MSTHLAGVALLLLTMTPTSLAGADPSSPRDEQYWRSAFRGVRDASDALENCHMTLADYCTWERLESHKRSETDRYQAYLEARRRGEHAEDPLATKVYVPEACQRALDTSPRTLRVETTPDAPQSCRTRINALLAAIESVEVYWNERAEQLEQEARHAAVPHRWRE